MIHFQFSPTTFIALIGSVTAVLSGSIINLGLPALGCNLGIEPAHLPWVVGSYMLALAIVLPFGGFLGDVLGLRMVTGASIALLAGASMICAGASWFGVLLAGRLLQGIGTALILPNAVALIGTVTGSGSARHRLFIHSASCTAASGLGPFVGSWSTGCDGWRLLFGMTTCLASMIAIAFQLCRPIGLGTRILIPAGAATKVRLACRERPSCSHRKCYC